jgi:hypothetical protein
MSNESSVNSVEMVDRARSWDHPNGLGWQLWRRAHSTGILTQPIQRDLARFRASIRDPAPLASDIRTRWGVGANTRVDRFGLDLPFFLGRFPSFRGSTSHHLSVSGPGTAHRSTDISRSSSAYETSQSSRPTISPSSPNTEVDSRETAQAMAPQSAVGFGDTIVPSLARRAVPAAVSLNQERSGRNDSRFALTTLLTRRSLLPPRFMTTLQRLPLVPGTGLLSSTILERYDSIPALVPRSRAKFPETENRSVLALTQPSYEVSTPLETTARRHFGTTANSSLSVPDALARDAAAWQGELRAGAQDSPALTAQSMDYAPSSVSRSDLQPAIPVAGQRERTIARTASSKPGGVNSSMSEGTALTTDHDVTSSIVKRNSAPQRHGLGDVTNLQPGGLMTGVILRALGTRSPVGVRVPLSTVVRQQFEHMNAPYGSKFAPTFRGRGFVSTLNRSTYGPIQGFDPAAGPEQIGGNTRASSIGTERSVERKTLSGEQPRTDGIIAPIVQIQMDTAGTKIAPSTGLPLTNPATSQMTGTLTGPFIAGANSRPGQPTQSNERGRINFAGGYAPPVFTAQRTVIGLRPTAMPLTISPIFKRDGSMRAGAGRQIFPMRSSAVVLTASRADDHGSLGFDNSIRGDETGEGISQSFGDGSRIFRAQEASDEDLVFGRLPNRAGIETRHVSDDSTRTSGGTMPGQPYVGELPATDVHDSLSMEVRISRAAVTSAGFGTARDYDDAGIPQGWLPMNQARLPLGGGIVRTQRSLQRVIGRSAAPLLIAGSGAIRTAGSDQLPGIPIPSQAIQSTEPLPVEWIRDVRAGESSEFHLPSAGLTSVLSPMRAVTINRSALMRRSDVPPHQEPHAPALEMRGTSHEMPFAALPVIRDERGLAALHRPNGTSLQTAPQETSSAANRFLPIDVSAETGRVETPTAASKPQIDLDELVEKAWQKLMRKLTIEQERRGYTRWL